MREYNAFQGYPEPQEPRYVEPDFRTIRHRIKATYRDKDLYDGDRAHGYGGLKYDGRWVPIAKHIYQEYKLNSDSAVLQVGCQKGFLLQDLLALDPNLRVRGTEVSQYPIDHASPEIRPLISLAPFTEMPFADAEFDLVIAVGAVYSLTLTDAIRCLKEIQRVCRGTSFITLASYSTMEDLRLFKLWSLLGETVLTKEEWLEVLQHVDYQGDYTFVNAQSLHLVEKPR